MLALTLEAAQHSRYKYAKNKKLEKELKKKRGPQQRAQMWQREHFPFQTAQRPDIKTTAKRKKQQKPI